MPLLQFFSIIRPSFILINYCLHFRFFFLFLISCVKTPNFQLEFGVFYNKIGVLYGIRLDEEIIKINHISNNYQQQWVAATNGGGITSTATQDRTTKGEDRENGAPATWKKRQQRRETEKEAPAIWKKRWSDERDAKRLRDWWVI